MLKLRILTAVILLPLIAALIFYAKPVYFDLVLLLLIAAGAWEWSSMIDLSNRFFQAIYVVSIVAFVISSPYFSTIDVLLAGLLMWVWFFGAIVLYQQRNRSFGLHSPTVRALAGYLLFASSYLALMNLRGNPLFGAPYLFFVLCIIWSTDIGAYVTGKWLGKKQLVSKVSPKKTWAGFFGGIIVAMITTVLGVMILHQGAYLEWLCVGFGTALFSVVGDLGVSLIKRIAQKKDSGFLFPGHGGVLDRYDSIAAGAIVFILMAVWLGS